MPYHWFETGKETLTSAVYFHNIEEDMRERKLALYPYVTG